MVKLQVGVFPGKIDDYVVEAGTTIGEVLSLAGLSQGPDQDIKVDGEVVDPDYVVDENTNLVILSKRIKGA